MMRPKMPGKWIRWRYVLPRLLIVAIVVVSVRYALDPVLRWAAVRSGEAALGAKVEIGSFKTNLRAGTLTVGDLAAANPSRPMKNLFESKSGALQLDVNALFHKRFVVTDGEVAGIQFDTARTESGALDESARAEDETGPSLWDPLAKAAEQESAAWIEGVGGRLESDIVDQLQSPRLAKDLEDRWPQEYESMETQVNELRERATAIEQEFRQVKANPLRNLHRLEQLQGDLQTADVQLRALTQKLQQLPQQIETDRQAVMTARTHDEALLREKLQFDHIDGDQLSFYLLGNEAESNLAKVVGWLRYARYLLPSNDSVPEPPQRGVFVSFEREPRPQWLIEKVRLLGSAQVSGQELLLAGALTDACSHPQLHPRPAELRLTGTGPVHVQAVVQIDRRDLVPRDTLRLECPDLQIPGRTLGRPEKLAISLPAGPAVVLAHVELVGEQLSGTISFSQPQVRLQPTVGSVNDPRLSDAIANALARVDGFRADVVLAGTLENPDWHLDSNLGPQLASGINGAVGQYLAQRRDLLLEKTERQIDQRLAQLNEKRQEAQGKLLAKLGENQQLLAALAPLAGGDAGAGGISLPRLGRALAEGVLK